MLRVMSACLWFPTPNSGSSVNLWGKVRPSPKLEKIGNAIFHHVSPNTSEMLPLLPRLKPSLSGPRLKVGDLKASRVVLLCRTRWM